MENAKKSIKTTKVYSMVLIALFAALTAVFSQIAIPLPGLVPINLATLSVFVAGGLLGVGKATISQVIYVLIGAVGLPVFSGFRGGIGVLAGPTGGYIVGYVLAALAISLILAKTKKGIIPVVLALIAGIFVCYAFGTAWYIISTNTEFWAALGSCVLPFLPGDAAKIIVAAILIVRLKNIV